MNQILAAMILFAAVICDLWAKRIPNLLIIAGYLLGCLCHYLEFGFAHMYYLPIRALWPVLVLYIFYYFGAVGAGDIKLFSCLSVFLPIETTFHFIIFSYSFAAVYAFLKLLVRKELFIKLEEVKEYFAISFMAGRLYGYKASEESVFCFSLFMAVGYAASLLMGVIN